MQKLKRFNANLVTKTFFPGVKPERINSGLCCNWAFYAYLLFPNVKLCSFLPSERLFEGDNYPSHAYVKCNGRVYDAEVPNGVKSFMELPCYMRCQKYEELRDDVEISYRCERLFRIAWTINKVNWFKIVVDVRTYLKSIMIGSDLEYYCFSCDEAYFNIDDHSRCGIKEDLIRQDIDYDLPR